MKDKPAFKPLQENPASIQVMASRCPFQLRQQTQGPSHIPIAEGSLLLRCLWKVGIPLQSKPGNQLSSLNDMACTELSSSFCAYFGFPLYVGLFSQGISGVSERKSSHFHIWCGKRDNTGSIAGESGLISQRGGSLMVFLEFRREPGVYSRVTAGMSIRNSSLFIEVRNLSRYEGQLRNVN